jgi:hypothetical protein
MSICSLNSVHCVKLNNLSDCATLLINVYILFLLNILMIIIKTVRADWNRCRINTIDFHTELKYHES